MKDRRQWMMVLVVFSVLLAASGCSLFTTVVRDADDGAFLKLDIGDLVEIRLEGTPSSGYEWVRIDPASLEGGPLEAVSEAEIQDTDGHVVGAPCKYAFRYRAIRAGTIVLTFVHRRAWEPDEPIDTYSVTVWVR